MKRLLVAVALVAAALPVRVGAESPLPADARVEWARQYRAHARNLPVASLLDAADALAAVSTGHYAFLEPAGDLDGDGAGDVADLRIRQTYDAATDAMTTTIRVEARRGRDGRLLWTRTVGGAEYPYVFFAPVGANGRQGMVVVAKFAEVADADEAYATAGTASVAAFDGAGKPLWTYDARRASAISPVSAVVADVYADSVGDLVAGRALDMLLESRTFALAADPVGAVDESAWLVQLQVLDGATGKVRDLGQPYVVTGEQAWPAVVGDVSGDKLDDVAYVDDEGGAPTLRLVRSSDGARHAAVTGIPADEFYVVRRVLDVTGDRVADVLVMAYADRPSTSLVDAGRARVAWSRAGTAAYVVGDADRRAGSEIVMNESLDVAGGMGFRLTAVNGAGRTVWTATRTLKGAGGSMLGNMSVSAGDAQGDGVTDFRYSMSLGSSRREDGFVDGRTGRVRTGLPADLLPAGAAFDGRGEDAFTRTYRTGAVTLTAWRGDGSARLWQTSMPATGASAPTFGAALDRDRCADLAVTVGGPRTTTYVLSGATGAPMWALSRFGDGAGVVLRPRLATRRFVRTC